MQLSAEDPSGLSSHVRLVVVVASGQNDPPQVHVPGATYVEEPCDSRSGTVGFPSPQHPPPISRQCRRITNVDRIQAFEDTPLTLAGISIEDSDINESGPSAQIHVDVEAQHGSLAFTEDIVSPPPGVLFLHGGNPEQRDHLLSMRGSLGFVNAALARLRYTPDPDWSGSDEVVIRASDQGFTGSGGEGTDSRGVPIDVAPRNDPPLLLVTAAGAGGAGATAPPPPLEMWEDSRVVLHNTTLYDADVNPRELHGQILGVSSGTPYEEYPADINGGQFEVTVSVDHGRVFFSRTARLAFEHASLLNTQQSAEGVEQAIQSLTQGNFSASTGETVDHGTLSAPWWREATFTGHLHDCNSAIGAMTYRPDVNWNGVDRVHVSVIESHLVGTDGSTDNTVVSSSLPVAEVSIFVRVAAVNDAPVVTPPSPRLHSTLLTGDMLSRRATYGNRAFVHEDTELLLPGFVIRDVDLTESGGGNAFLVVTVTCGHGTASITWHGLRAGVGKGDSRHPMEENSLGADLTGLLFRDQDTGEWAAFAGSSMGQGAATFTFRASLADANAALESLAFRPKDNFFGSGAWVKVEAYDKGLSGQPFLATTTPIFNGAENIKAVSARGEGTVPVTVLAVNDAPQILLPFSEDGQAILRLDEGEERRLDGARWRGSFAAAVQASAHYPLRKGMELWGSQGVFPERDAGRWGKASQMEWKETLVRDVNEGVGDGSPRHFVVWGGYLYFQVSEAWKTCFLLHVWCFARKSLSREGDDCRGLAFYRYP